MTATILGVRVYTTNYVLATKQVLQWALEGERRFVCAANVHMLMEAWDDPDFRQTINLANMVSPDGMPLVWLLRLKGHKHQKRVYGPTLMLHILKMAAIENISVGFYGGSPVVLENLVYRMQAKFPNLKIMFSHSPPFRDVIREENIEIISKINNSGTRILFIGLGCPKQERWMAKHRNRIAAVMLGVGAAFDFHASAISQSPEWLQKIGLEWLFRLIQEPGRLWKRYLYQNPRFVVLAFADLMGLLKIK